MRAALSVIVLAGCGFSIAGKAAGDDVVEDGGPDAPPDVPPDAPPPSTSVRITSVTSSIPNVRPGRYGFDVTVVVTNELAVEITDVAVSLDFHSGTTDRNAQFRWRDHDAREGVTTPHATRIAAGEDETFVFRVDALASAAPPDAIEIDGVATFVAEGMAFSALGLVDDTELPFENLNAPIVVTNATDERDGTNNLTSFREAIERAQAQGGRDRIVFDPAVFPPNNTVATVLSRAIGALPTITTDLVIDGTGAGFTLALDATWQAAPSVWGLRVGNGSLVVHGIRFRDLAYNYPQTDLTNDNCLGGVLDGGAIRVDGGTLILDSNTFEDPNVSERNCHASSVRLSAGSNHRIVNNTWTNQVMDAIYVDTPVIEITDNVMNAGTRLEAVDECVYYNDVGNVDTWLIGNICADMEYGAVYAGGNENRRLHIVHNTFVRNGRVDLSAIRRADQNRRMTLRNNVYIGNNPAAIHDANYTNYDISHEAISGNPLCNTANCPNATLAAGTTLDALDLGLTAQTGSTRTALTPTATSPLVDSGTPMLDRNGKAPRWFNGTGPDRGAVER